MPPHDLLCRWCSTFVGRGQQFCSIFCESRYTRSKRRNLAFKRPVYSSGPTTVREYTSPHSSKATPEVQTQFLEDVVTAMGDKKPLIGRGQTSPVTPNSTNTNHDKLSDITVPPLNLRSKSARPELVANILVDRNTIQDLKPKKGWARRKKATRYTNDWATTIQNGSSSKDLDHAEFDSREAYLTSKLLKLHEQQQQLNGRHRDTQYKPGYATREIQSAVQKDKPNKLGYATREIQSAIQKHKPDKLGYVTRETHSANEAVRRKNRELPDLNGDKMNGMICREERALTDIKADNAVVCRKERALTNTKYDTGAVCGKERTITDIKDENGTNGRKERTITDKKDGNGMVDRKERTITDVKDDTVMVGQKERTITDVKGDNGMTGRKERTLTDLNKVDLKLDLESLKNAPMLASKAVSSGTKGKVERQKSQTGSEYEIKTKLRQVRTAGHGAPVNQRLRPLPLKPKSAGAAQNRGAVHSKQVRPTMSANSNKYANTRHMSNGASSLATTEKVVKKKSLQNQQMHSGINILSKWKFIPTFSRDVSTTSMASLVNAADDSVPEAFHDANDETNDKVRNNGVNSPTDAIPLSQQPPLQQQFLPLPHRPTLQPHPPIKRTPSFIRELPKITEVLRESDSSEQLDQMNVQTRVRLNSTENNDGVEEMTKQGNGTADFNDQFSDDLELKNEGVEDMLNDSLEVNTSLEETSPTQPIGVIIRSNVTSTS